MTYHWDFSFILNYQNILLAGAFGTLKLSLAILLFGLACGTIFALARLSRWKALNAAGALYVEVFRNVPALVLLFWFYYVIPLLSGIQNEKFLTAVVAFSLYTGAYFCEILRGGVQSLDRGQWEASAALGMPYRTTFIYIVLPQTIRRTLPALTNEAIEVIKISSIAATIAYPEMLYQASVINNSEYRPVEAYTVIAALLTGIILVLSALSYSLERRFQKAN